MDSTDEQRSMTDWLLHVNYVIYIELIHILLSEITCDPYRLQNKVGSLKRWYWMLKIILKFKLWIFNNDIQAQFLKENNYFISLFDKYIYL